MRPEIQPTKHFEIPFSWLNFHNRAIFSSEHVHLSFTRWLPPTTAFVHKKNSFPPSGKQQSTSICINSGEASSSALAFRFSHFAPEHASLLHSTVFLQQARQIPRNQGRTSLHLVCLSVRLLSLLTGTLWRTMMAPVAFTSFPQNHPTHTHHNHHTTKTVSPL